MATERIPRTDLPGYFQGISRRLQLQVESMTPVVVHTGEMGDNDHTWFAEVLRQYLPQKYGVDTGFVVNKDSDKGSADFFATSGKPRTQDPYISPQMDILILDVLHNAPLCSEKTFKVCPTEMVLGAVEVTRDLDKKKLAADICKLVRVKELAASKCYLQTRHTGWEINRFAENIYYQRPFTCVVGLGGGVKREDIESAMTTPQEGTRPNAVFLLDDALYLLRDEDQLSIIEQDCLYHLISLMRLYLDWHLCESVNLQAYLPPQVMQLVSGSSAPAPPAQEGDRK